MDLTYLCRFTCSKPSRPAQEKSRGDTYVLRPTPHVDPYGQKKVTWWQEYAQVTKILRQTSKTVGTVKENQNRKQTERKFSRELITPTKDDKKFDVLLRTERNKHRAVTKVTEKKRNHFDGIISSGHDIKVKKNVSTDETTRTTDKTETNENVHELDDVSHKTTTQTSEHNLQNRSTRSC